MLKFLTLAADGLCAAALAHSMAAPTARSGGVRVVMNPPLGAALWFDLPCPHTVAGDPHATAL